MLECHLELTRDLPKTNITTTTPSFDHGCPSPKFSNGLAPCLFRSNCVPNLRSFSPPQPTMDISSINEVLVRLQHIHTDRCFSAQGQMINDGELRSAACHRLCAACRVVNSALDRILDPSSGHKPTVSSKIRTRSQSTEQWTEHDFERHYLFMYLFVSSRNISMFKIRTCHQARCPSTKTTACCLRLAIINKGAFMAYNMAVVHP